MTYKLKFLPAAKKEWDKLRDYDYVYKIKLRTVGYRLAYEVSDDEIVVYVLAVGKRDKNAIYKK
ncbi:RelE [Psychromonas sp. CNPT3]|uniref:type II toxin-antitoxin system RelE family toxin n=1 Tax=Psychromonas sp. CNPT3 TaxID=314282 RepID=UPI00006E50C8|nr:type II toxin-antitoxin system RelE/ParE family toxin [Psychromonas sp. CNPT3]AGH81653.1 RelE [Psychromonas sp. CNPT3]